MLSFILLLAAITYALPSDNQTVLFNHRKPFMMAYYPDWAGLNFQPEFIDFKKFDWIDFAFALPDSQFNLSWDNGQDAPKLLSRLVSAAHAHDTKVKLSVGGWTGSKFVSSLSIRA